MNIDSYPLLHLIARTHIGDDTLWTIGDFRLEYGVNPISCTSDEIMTVLLRDTIHQTSRGESEAAGLTAIDVKIQIITCVLT